MKKITYFFLAFLALIFVFPVLFLAVGSLMGKNELTGLLLPVMQEAVKDMLPGNYFQSIRL